jgi:hypothetical protein
VSAGNYHVDFYVNGEWVHSDELSNKEDAILEKLIPEARKKWQESRTPVNKCPYRSPQIISETIKDIICDKVVCELGSAEGDNLVFMSKYAKKVIGIERDLKRHEKAVARGLDVRVGDYKLDPSPEADVYYFWPNDGEADNEFLVNKILSNNFKGIIIIAGDMGHPPEIPSVKRCAEKGKLLTVPFNEGNGWRENGVFLLAIIDAKDIHR